MSYSYSSSSYDSTSSTPNIQDFINDLATLNQGAAFVGVVVGMIFCFFGLKLFKCMMFCMGFGVGFGVGIAMGFAAQSSGAAVLLALVLGVGGGFVMMWCRKVVYFMFGFTLGSVLGLALNVFILSKSGNIELSTLGTSTFIMGIVGGIFAVYIGDLIVILSTAISGSFQISFYTIPLFQMKLTSGGTTGIVLLELIAFIALGIWFQLKKREEWKGVLEVHNTVNVNTNVNTNVSNENKIEIKIEQPIGQPQYPGMMYPQQGYNVPFMQNPYGQFPQQAQPGQPDQQYAQPQQYSQPQMYSQPQQYVQPQQYNQPPQYGQPEYAKPVNV